MGRAEDTFVNPESAAFLRKMTAEEWEELLLNRWDKDTPEPVVFDDGTMYGECGREVERRMFWLFHKEDDSLCRCRFSAG